MRIENDQIILENIPIAEHTSKYRFKRKTERFIDYLASQEDTRIGASDYIEWQISYDIKIDNIYKTLIDGNNIQSIFSEGKNPDLLRDIIAAFEETSVEQSKIKRKKLFTGKLTQVCANHHEPIIHKVRENKEVVVLLNELTDFIKLALNNGLLSLDELRDLVRFADSVKETIDELYGIERERCRENTSSLGCELYHEKYPLLIKNISDTFFAEIIKKHMQYAMGYQNMIYLCINAQNIKDTVGQPILGRTVGEINGITCLLDKSVLIEISKTFIVASQSHKRDMLDLINAIIEP